MDVTTLHNIVILVLLTAQYDMSVVTKAQIVACSSSLDELLYKLNCYKDIWSLASQLHLGAACRSAANCSKSEIFKGRLSNFLVAFCRLALL